jgi:hypothetical protein
MLRSVRRASAFLFGSMAFRAGTPHLWVLPLAAVALAPAGLQLWFGLVRK